MGNSRARTQEQVNRAVWARPQLVAEYAHRRLLTVERVALDRYAWPLSGDVLELGCGAGRVTGHLLHHAASVHGLDVMPEMVDYCRQAYPDGSFSVGDLRDLSAFPAQSFDAVVAVANVIDVLEDAGRQDVLDQVRGLLAPGGVFVMAAHNLAAAPLIDPPRRVGSGSRRQLVVNVLRLPLRAYNRHRLRALEQVAEDHAILNDIAHDYALLHYYIGRDAQERQLAAHGLRLEACLDEDGRTVPPGATAPQSHSLLYVSTASAPA